MRRTAWRVLALALVVNVAFNLTSLTIKLSQTSRSTTRPDAFHATALIRSAIVTAQDVISRNTPSMEYPDVCFYGSTPFFFTQKTTKSFAVNLMTVLGDVALRSYNDALIGKGRVRVLLPITTYKPHFTSLEHLLASVNVSGYEKLDVAFRKDAYENARKQFRNTKCKWVVSVKLDADDVIFPGYLDWIAQKIIPTLDNGALVASRHLPRVYCGYGRCMLADKRFEKKKSFYGGWAVGQTRVFRRDIFKALDMPFQAPAHTTCWFDYRRAVFEKILKITPPTILPKSVPMSLRRNFSIQEAMDPELENKTGIRMIETTAAGFGPAGVYMMTPLSGHFNYGSFLSGAKQCSSDQWSHVMADTMRLNGIKSTMVYIRDVIHATNMTLFDTCSSHNYFIKDKRTWFGGSTCEEMETGLKQALAKASPSR